MAKIRLTIHQSTGTILKDAHTKQHAYPSIEVTNEKGCILSVAMTFEQLAQMLVSHSEVTCTVTRWNGPNGIEKENVEEPITIRQRADNTFGEYHTELSKRIKDLRDRVYDTLNVGKAGKSELKEILRDITVISENYRSNHGYLLEKTQEEIDSMRDNAVTQIHALLSTSGLPQQIAQSFTEQQKIEAPQKDSSSSVPIMIERSDYKKVVRQPEEMTNLELADNISIELKRFEAMKENHTDKKKEKYSQLFWSGASESTKGVNIVYISYQGSHLIPHDVAIRYLTFLRSINTFKEFKTDFWFEKKE